MTHEQLVEKVAEAICLAFDGPLEFMPDKAKEDYRIQARAAIAAIYEAMREPDDAMVEVGSDILLDGAEWGKRPSAYDCYTAMLDASPLNGE